MFAGFKMAKTNLTVHCNKMGKFLKYEYLTVFKYRNMANSFITGILWCAVRVVFAFF